MSRVEKNKNNKKSKKKTKKSKGAKIFLTLLFIFLLVCIGGGTYIGYTLSRLNNGATNLSSGKDKNNTTNKDKKEQKESINILVMGVDIGTPGATNKDDPKRTDTIILANYNLKTEKMSLISIPRDTYIEINGKDQKINAAHAIGGVPYLVDAVEKLLDVKIDYYGKIDYAGFRALMDAIGGVDMEITRNMYYDDPEQNLHIHFKKGTVAHLDGKKAEEFFRWRKNNDNTGLAEGDIGRIKNQHLFISKVIEKLKSPSIIPKIPSILNIIPKYAETNMSADEIIKYGLKFSSINMDNLKMETLQGDAHYYKGLSYFFYDEKLNSDILQMLHGSDYVVFNKSDLKIQVLNGTKKSGLAGDFSSFINNKGYSNVSVGNGESTSKTKMIINGVDEKVAKVIQKDFNIDNVEVNSSKDGNFDIIVLLGNDHDYINK